MHDVSGLLPYQAASVPTLVTAIRRYGAALDASDTGVGKTYTAMAVARELGIKPLVVCPKSVISAWHEVAEYLGGECFSLSYEKLRTGNTEWGSWEVVRVMRERKMNYETMQYEIVERPIKRFVFDPEIPLIFFDEGHRCKALNSLNSKMMIAAGRQRIPTLVMSATVAENPTHMRALGYLLRLHDMKAFTKFCKMFGCSHQEGSAMPVFTNKAKLRELHHHLFKCEIPRGVRIKREELGDAFPECQITADLYDMPKAAEMDALYEEMGEALARLEDRMADDVDDEHPLTKLLRARQRAEILKVPLFVQLFEEAHENGMRPVLFVNFNETIEAIQQRLEKKFKLSIIRGGQTAKERDQYLADFRDNVADGVLANEQAGGVGISMHDLHGGFPRVAYISPNFSAMRLIQTLGRIWRQGAKSKALQRIVLAAGTVEQKIHTKLKSKLNDISMINDGDLSPFV